MFDVSGRDIHNNSHSRLNSVLFVLRIHHTCKNYQQVFRDKLNKNVQETGKFTTGCKSKRLRTMTFFCSSTAMIAVTY